MENQNIKSQLQKQIDELKIDLQKAEFRIASEAAAREIVEERLAKALKEVEVTKQEHLESEQHYKMLIENTHDVIYSVTPDGIMTYLSPQMTQFGYSPEELISKNFIDFVAPEQRQEVIYKFTTGTAAGESFPTQFQWINKDGGHSWIEVIGKTLFDESGNPVQQIGVIRDIDERKRQNEEKENLLLLLDTLDGECFIKDKDGIYQYINRAFETQFSVKREDVIGKDDTFVFGAETAAILRENDKRIMASRKPEAVEEATYLKGQNFVVYLTNKTPIIDENGNVTGICGIGVDITYQKQIEDQLRGSEEKYRILVEQISEVIYSIDLDGMVTFISPAVEPFIGYSPSEVIGQSFVKFISSDDLSHASDSFKQLSGGATPRPNEYRALTKSGETRWMLTSSQPVLEGDQVIGVQGVLTDITERKQMAMALEERVKEMNCLYGISRLLEKPGISLDKFLHEAVNLIPLAWQYPEITSARILLEDQEFKSEGFEETTWQLRCDINLLGNPIGWVEVCYKEERPEIDEGPFLVEERMLLNAICERLGKIVQRMRTEQALQESEEKFRLISETSIDTIYQLDTKGNILFMNTAGARMYGYEPGEMEGLGFAELLTKEGRAEGQEHVKSVLSGESVQGEMYVKHKDGHKFPIYFSMVPVEKGGEIVGLSGISRDITERKQVEEQLELAAAIAERERLARELHDSVSQTLYSVAAIAEVLPRIWERNQQEAQAGLGELTSLTNAALAEMRILLLELRPGALEKQNLAELLHQLVRGLMGRTRLPVNLSVDDDCSMPPDVQIALYRIAQEALNNIVRHARASQAQVSLECVPGLVKLLISDDGVGFNPKSVTSHRMGLDIMPERAQDIGAVFEIDSQPDQGTQISVLWQDQQEG